MGTLTTLWHSFSRCIWSLVPSPRYVRHLELQLERERERIGVLEEEKRQMVNGLLIKAGLNEIHVNRGSREAIAPSRRKYTPSSWRRQNEVNDLESIPPYQQ